MKAPTPLGLSRIVNRAAREFKCGRDNTAHAYLASDGTIHLHTQAAGGDNVPWAQDLHRHTVRAILRYLGADWPAVKPGTHGQGSVSSVIATRPGV